MATTWWTCKHDNDEMKINTSSDLYCCICIVVCNRSDATVRHCRYNRLALPAHSSTGQARIDWLSAKKVHAVLLQKCTLEINAQHNTQNKRSYSPAPPLHYIWLQRCCPPNMPTKQHADQSHLLRYSFLVPCIIPLGRKAMCQNLERYPNQISV